MLIRAGLFCVALAAAPWAALAQPVPPAGLQAEGLKQWERALSIYRSALAREPGRRDLWLRISDIEARLGRKAAAAEALRAAAAAKRTDAALWRRASGAFAAADNPREALAMLDRAAELEPGRIDDLHARAQLATWLGDYAAAEAAWREHHRRSGQPESLLNLARVLGWQGKTDEAARHFRGYRSIRPADAAASLDHARVEMWRGNHGGALDILDDYRARHGATAESLGLKAEVYARAGHWFAANALIAQTPPPSQGEFQAHFIRALAAHESWRVDPAFAALEESRKLRPDDRGLADIRRAAGARVRSFVEPIFGYATDTDRIRTLTAGAVGALRTSNRLYLEAGTLEDWLTAPRGSGLDAIDGRRGAAVYRAWAGLRRSPADDLWASLRLGSAHTSKGDATFYYAVAADYRPWDGVQLRLDADHDYHAVSPRAISLGIRRYGNLATASWQLRDLRHTLVAAAGYDVLSDGNRRWSALVEPRRAVLRTQNFNLDIGVSGRWSGFAHDFDHGYYDPRLYQQYLVVFYGYIKLNDDDGISIVAAPGVHKDDRMDHFAASGSIQGEATFGLHSDWQLKLAGGTGFGIGVLNRTYQRSFGTVRLMRRF